MNDNLSAGGLQTNWPEENAPELQRAAKLREAILRREIACLLQERAGLRAEGEALRATVEQLKQQLESATPPAVASPPVPIPTIFRHSDVASTPTRTSRRRDIFVAADFPPLFDMHSGGMRLKALIDMLGQACWRITFGSLADRKSLPGVLASVEGRGRYEDALRSAGVTRFCYGTGEMDDFLVEAGGALDWAFLSFPHVAENLMPLVRSRCPTTRIVFDMVDLHCLRLAREAALRNDLDLLATADRQRNREIACATAADVTLAVTVEEKTALLELAPEAVVEVLPNVFEVPCLMPPGPEERDGLLFVGGFWHEPNGDAVLWFIERIWPILLRELPDLQFCIAGSNPTDEVLALNERPGVEVVGYVPDLTPLFNRHRVFVAPLRYGAGMKGKVGQSLSHGLPVVSTTIGAEGMGLQDGAQVLVADEEDAFAVQVLRLLRDDELWSRLSAGGRAHIERTFSVDVVRQQLERVLGG